ncbi:MAG: RluA family pseudouridine synthase [Candidatus Omnitrophica bacterium]|nr:RluA family pseudouridine synthase [Candidatus Omnitrophota bacterium]
MSAPVESFSVDPSHQGKRLDLFLHLRFPFVSRATIQRLIEQGDVLVNAGLTKSSHRLHAGEQIHLRWPEPKPAVAQPESMPLDILFEDAELLVLNKPPGLVTHPAAGHEEHTLVNALLHHCAGQLSGIGGVARPGIVHRLDKETSGCLVVAKTDAAHLSLAEQFAQRRVEKVYHALVCGELPEATGEIRAAIARHPTHRKRMAVAEGRGRDAWTTFRVLARLTLATLVEAHLHTGRTHQVRVHFQHIGFPLVGDTTYGKRANLRLAELTGYTAPRQMLHAWRLSFTHPRSALRMTFEAPWPDDLSAAMSALKPGADPDFEVQHQAPIPC